MTEIVTKDKIKKLSTVIRYLTGIFLFGIAIFFSEAIKRGFTKGLRLCASTILPTLFPFFILSDYWCFILNINPNSKLSLTFTKIFNISGYGLSAFIIGCLCGFPLGVKTATDLYSKDKLSKSELESLIGFINNPSSAFIISGVGAGMLNDVAFGVKLYFCVISSAIISGLITREKRIDSQKTSNNFRQSFSFVSSVKSAALSSLQICAFVSFFSALNSLISIPIKNIRILCLVASFVEISSSSQMICELKSSLGGLFLPLLAFALGFSGFSVHMQAFAFLPADISKKKYFANKLLQGTFSALLILLLNDKAAH
jgi:hypothetical protein